MTIQNYYYTKQFRNCKIYNRRIAFRWNWCNNIALDDYEEGTWTPNIGGTSSSVVYGTQSGVYRKIGSMVYVYCQISINTYGSQATSSSILGLPFSPTKCIKSIFWNCIL